MRSVGLKCIVQRSSWCMMSEQVSSAKHARVHIYTYTQECTNCLNRMATQCIYPHLTNSLKSELDYRRWIDRVPIEIVDRSDLTDDKSRTEGRLSIGAGRAEQIKSNGDHHCKFVSRGRFRWLSIIADNHFARRRFAAPPRGAQKETGGARTKELWYNVIRGTHARKRGARREKQFRAQRIANGIRETRREKIEGPFTPYNFPTTRCL